MKNKKRKEKEEAKKSEKGPVSNAKDMSALSVFTKGWLRFPIKKFYAIESVILGGGDLAKQVVYWESFML